MSSSILQIGGAALSAGATIAGSRSEAKELKKEAAQLEFNAGQQRASSQRQAIEEKRQGRLAASRALALAAASGGGADDPSIINAIADLEGEGEYRALTALYQGNIQGDDMERQAAARRREAKNVKKVGLLKAGSTILTTAGSMMEKYSTGTSKGGK